MSNRYDPDSLQAHLEEMDRYDGLASGPLHFEVKYRPQFAPPTNDARPFLTDADDAEEEAA